MKKFLPYILILTIVVQLFAPFSVAPGTKNNLEIKNNKVEAENEECKILDENFTSPSPLPTIDTPKPESISYLVKTTGCKGKVVALSVHAYGGLGTAIPFMTDYKEILSDNFIFSLKTGEKYCNGNDCDNIKMSITIRESIGDVALVSKISEDSLAYKCSEDSCSDEKNWEIIGVDGLKTDGQNFADMKAAGVKAKEESGFPACTFDFWNTIGGCVGIGMYYIFFVPTSLIFGLTGKILDFTFMYSISDEAYRSGFVIQGWEIVRDFCNMFFIFVLLYIAFGTILGLHSVKTKEMIINVVIIGLLINFSLFATQVIIDASNILARVFYNQNTIVTGIKDPETGIIKNETGEFKELKLSEAIVSKVDPQQLIIQSKKVNAIPQKGISGEETEGNISAGSFIIVVILATIINIVGMIAFLSVGLIFISRVIGLWLAMIVSPLVFFSYTVPALQNMEMVGWKKWWPETIKLAFLAPIFAFFMYLVIGFMDKGMGVIDASHQNSSSLNFLVAIIVPFIFIMILLIKAKDIAKDMSGKIGQKVAELGEKVGATGGMLALGAATGGMAMLGRNTLGALGNKMANSKAFANTEAGGNWVGKTALGRWGAKMALKSGDKLQSSSFDARATGAGKALAKGIGATGGMDIIKVNKGGYKALEQNRIAQRTNRAEELKHIASHHEEVEKRKEEVGKKQLEIKASKETGRIEKELAEKKEAYNYATDPESKKKLEEEINKLKAEQKNIVTGGKITEKDEEGKVIREFYNTDNGLMGKEAYEDIKKKEKEKKTSVDKLENEKGELETKLAETMNTINNSIKDINEKEKVELERLEKDLLSKHVGFGRKQELSDNDRVVLENKKQEFSKKKSDLLSSKDVTDINEKIGDKEKEISKANEEWKKANEELASANSETDNGKNLGKSIKTFNTEIGKIKHKIEHEQADIANKYATSIEKMNKVVGFFVSGNTQKGRSEAVDKIRLGLKTNSVDVHAAPIAGGGHGGGGHGGGDKHDAHEGGGEDSHGGEHGGGDHSKH